jgi:hypothetical protein
MCERFLSPLSTGFAGERDRGQDSLTAPKFCIKKILNHDKLNLVTASATFIAG